MQGNITDWGKEVKKGLIERGWSINDLAERIGKSRTRVSGVVNGRIYSDSIASAISDLLNIEKASASMKEATRDWCMDARKAMIDLDMNTARHGKRVLSHWERSWMKMSRTRHWRQSLNREEPLRASTVAWIMSQTITQ